MTAMTSRPDVSRFDQRVVLYGKTWADYDAQLAIRGFDCSRPKVAFLGGALQLLSTSTDHGRVKWHLSRTLEGYCAEREIPMTGQGASTIRDEPTLAGAEPDECYLFGDFEKSRPDLVIDVVWTHGGIDMLEIYRRLEIPEVWFWETDQITVHVLGPTGYEVQRRSMFVPDLDLDEVCKIANGPILAVHELHREVRARLIPQH